MFSEGYIGVLFQRDTVSYVYHKRNFDGQPIESKTRFAAPCFLDAVILLPWMSEVDYATLLMAPSSLPRSRTFHYYFIFVC